MGKVLLGLGNPLGRDDAVGLRVAELLRGSDWTVFAVQPLENILGLLERSAPELLLVVDAAEIGLPPGSIRQLGLPSSRTMLGSTHGLPLSVLFSVFPSLTGKIVLIGIQPKDLGFGEDLSPEMEEAARKLVEMIRREEFWTIPKL